MIRKVLIANRGEIALRIMRSCREMGIRTVAIYSDADRKAMHVIYADEAYFVGHSPSNESYLNKDKIIEIAIKAKVDAVHPGYGFVSENADFARMCKDNNIIFIGPSEYAINTMGDKIAARKTMINANVPVVPGTTEAVTSTKEALKIVDEIGLPVMIKASAGGGGKGMRLVHKKSEVKNAVRAAKSEALSAFGDDSIFIEKYIEESHHIEFQVLADEHGNAVHLFERECSVQRRHQKVVEETPSPLLNQEIRMKMGEHAVAAAQAVDYAGAGTIEFIMDDNLNYYFLEMNTRLQVEHPITERVVGIDLVKQQIKIANGEKLAFKQSDLYQHGHSIEVRIYAEDPNRNFMPSPGKISYIKDPYGLGVRVDGYAYEGYEIPIYYDPMISKLVVWAPDRKEAINRMTRSLSEYKITGVVTNIPFLFRIIDSDDFRSGKYNTSFIEKHEDYLFDPFPEESEREDMAVIAAYIDYLDTMAELQPTPQNYSLGNNWKDLGRKRSILRM
ncbi:MAG: acetyl-CoA carboxylase biotin carboxylase subunit [Hyphomicrobiales bacterium]